MSFAAGFAEGLLAEQPLQVLEAVHVLVLHLPKSARGLLAVEAAQVG